MGTVRGGLREDWQRIKQNIESTIETSHYEALHQAIEQRCERVRVEIERRHERKLKKLPASADEEELKRKWVVNISSRLQSNETSLLRKGLNFAVTPRTVPTKEILASVEAAIYNLPREKQDATRAEIYGVLKQAKPPKQQNLTREERRALKDLKSDENIVIIRADKGNCTVVMNKTDYHNQVQEMLQDQNVYMPVTDKRRNPTSKTELELQRKFSDLKKLGNLSETEYWKLRPFDSTPASFYGLPKIHKVELKQMDDHFTLPENTETRIPLRPINSCIGAPTYELSKYLASLLKHLVNETEYSFKNAKQFAEFVSNQEVADDELVVSFDVVSLFTSIPIDMAIDVIQQKLEGSDDWRNHTPLTKGQILDLLSFLLHNSYFAFEGTQYHQVSGCTMGSPVSAVIAELVMQEVEEKALETSPVQPKWWRRYVDDSNACIKRDGVEAFHSHLNSINANIQFTVEMPTTTMGKNSIAFLDTNNTVNEDGRIEVGVYRKTTHTSKYLDFHSHSPAQSKRAVVKTLMDRAKCIPSTTAQRQNEKQRVVNDLKANGYPESFIKSAGESSKTNTQPRTQENPKAYTSIPYVKGVSERVRRVLSRENIKTAFKPVRTLGNIFKKPKDRPDRGRLKGIVYKVTCRTCSFAYVGESKRSWKSRGAEHKPGTNGNINSAIKHHAEIGHDIHPSYAEILETGVSSKNKRLFLESLHSFLDKNTINERTPFPRVYASLVAPQGSNEQ